MLREPTTGQMNALKSVSIRYRARTAPLAHARSFTRLLAHTFARAHTRSRIHARAPLLVRTQSRNLARVPSLAWQAIRDESIERIILDGTGTKVARNARRMAEARAAGIWVKVLYVRVSLETAERRNAKRDRVVPIGTLERYEQALERAVQLGRDHADAVEIVDNDQDSPADAPAGHTP